MLLVPSEFEKWRAICASESSMGGVLAWVAWVACLRGWHASVGGVGGVLFVQLVWQLVWNANVVGLDGVLMWVACYYYCYCYYWNTILKEKMLNVYFWNKNKQIFQIDLDSDLKEEPDLLYIIWAGNARIRDMSESQCGQICPDICNFVMMHLDAWYIQNFPLFRTPVCQLLLNVSAII